MKLTTAIAIVVLSALGFSQGKVKLNANFSDLVAGKAVSNVKVQATAPSVGRQIIANSPIDLPAPNGRAVPEPATMATLAIGAAALIRRRKARTS